MASTSVNSSAEYIASEIKRHKFGAALTLLLLVVALVGGAVGLYKLVMRTRDKPAVSPETMKVTKLTSSGNIKAEPVISADGQYVAYAVGEGEQQSLWIMNIPTKSSVRIVPPAKVRYWALAFPPDGNYVYYMITERGSANSSGTLYRVPILGGTPSKILEDLNGDITFSPDGRRFAFTRNLPHEAEGLVIANADTSEERTLATRKFSNGQSTFGIPAWSPDGKVIAFSVIPETTDQVYSEIHEIRVDNGQERLISSQQGLWIEFVRWLPDMSGLLVNANDGEIGKGSPYARQIWFISYTSGAAHRVTNDANSYVGISLAADGRTLATTEFDYRSGIWVAPGGDLGAAKRITSGKFDGIGGLTWTPAHQLIYTSSVGGKMNLFIANDDGSQARQLTNGKGEKYLPSVTPDGRYVVFVNVSAGKNYVWRIDIDGSDPKQLTNTGNEDLPRCSADSQWVFYIDSSNYRSWKVSVNGGVPVPIEWDRKVLDAEVSQDGKLIAFHVFDEKFSHSQIQVAPLGTTAPDKIFDIAVAGFHWSPDGQALTYLMSPAGGEPPTKLWSQPLSGGAPKQLINVEPDLIWSFNWSAAGRLAYARGSLSRDVVLISDFR